MGIPSPGSKAQPEIFSSILSIVIRALILYSGHLIPLTPLLLEEIQLRFIPRVVSIIITRFLLRIMMTMAVVMPWPLPPKLKY